MLEKKKNYLAILRLELEDLREDIDLLIKKGEQDKQVDTITNYVFLENLTLFKNEMLGLKVFDTIIESVDVDKFSELEELINYLKDTFKREMVEFGVSKAIHLSIMRKMDKVNSYVNQ